MMFDMHCHLHEFEDEEISKMLDEEKDLVIVAVSDDLDSFMRTLELWETFPDRVVPCAGFHPWNIGKKPLSQVDEIIRTAYRRDLACVGEVGLDKKFVGETFETQVVVFKKFIELAKEVGAFINIHAPDAWREVFSLLMESDVERAMFHWYTGPIGLIGPIGERGYYISINAAIQIQKKHRRVAESAPLDFMVFESDGPYEYRGLRLTPLMVRRAMEEVSKIKGVDIAVVESIAMQNSLRLIREARL